MKNLELPPLLLVVLVLLIVAIPPILHGLGYHIRLEAVEGEATTSQLDFSGTTAAREVYSRSAPFEPGEVAVTTGEAELVGEVAESDAASASAEPVGAADSSPDTLPETGFLSPRSAANPNAEARNIILLVGDGMGFSQLAAARFALVGPNGHLALDRFPITGWSFTHSAKELYTDSAAGATALATGFKTLPGRLSVSPDGDRLETLLEKAVAVGKSAGLVTDSVLVDATPAAFAAHRERRRDYLGIAQDMIESGATVLLGGQAGRLEQDPGWPETLGRFEAAGFQVARSAAELEQTSSQQPILGLLEEDSISDPGTDPSLHDLASLALEHLRHDPEGFFLLVETEETDTYSHRNVFDPVVAGVRELDRVAQTMVEFAKKDGSTLVLVTADHDTGGLAILGGEEGGPIKVRWATGNHTAEPVPLLAYGAGAERFSGVHDNHEIGQILQEILGVDSP